MEESSGQIGSQLTTCLEQPEIGVRLARDLSGQKSSAGVTSAEAPGALRGEDDSTGCRTVGQSTSEHREVILSAVSPAHHQQARELSAGW